MLNNYYFDLKKKSDILDILYVKKSKQYVDKVGLIIRKSNSFIIILYELKINFWLEQNIITSNNFCDNVIDRYIKCKLNFIKKNAK